MMGEYQLPPKWAESETGVDVGWFVNGKDSQQLGAFASIDMDLFFNTWDGENPHWILQYMVVANL